MTEMQRELNTINAEETAKMISDLLAVAAFGALALAVVCSSIPLALGGVTAALLRLK